MTQKFGVWRTENETAKNATVIEVQTPQRAALAYYGRAGTFAPIRVTVIDLHGQLSHFDCSTEMVPMLQAVPVTAG